MRERLLAIFGALALVAVAVVVRSLLTDANPSGSSGRNRPVVACTPDLMPICTALVAAGKIAPDPPSLDLGGDAMADPAIDGWITWDPAPGIANVTEPGAWADSQPIGSSPLAVATRPTAPPQLPDGCSLGALTWRCLADLGGSSIGVGTGRSAESLARLAPIAAELVPDGGDFTKITATDLATIVKSPAIPQQNFPEQLKTIRTAPGALSLLVGPQAALDRAKGLSVTQPTPAASVVAVYAVRRAGQLVDTAGLFGPEAVRQAVGRAGLTAGTTASLAPAERAGELFQVLTKVR